MRVVNAKRLSQIVRDLGRVPSRASGKIAIDLNKEIQSNFNRGVDPFGRKWKRLAKSTIARGRKWPPLTGKTRRGRESVVAHAMGGAGVAVVVGVLYMIYHQFGGKSRLHGHRKNKAFGRDKDREGRDSKGRGNPPRRSFLPQGKEFPPRWVDIIERAYKAAALKAWNG